MVDATDATDTFAQRSERVVRRYVKSVLLIDDQWPQRAAVGPFVDDPRFSDDAGPPALLEEENPSSTGRDEPPTSLEGKSPSFADDAGPQESVDDVAEELELPDPAILRATASNADAETLLAIEDAVLGKGILFSGIRYSRASHDVAASLAERADIIILDWHLVDGDDGTAARELLRGLGEGLHFVYVFTGHGRVDEVKQAIVDELGSDGLLPSTDESAFRVRNVIVAIRNKEKVDSPGVAGAKLYEDAVSSIARTYSGFVQLGLVELVQRHRDHLPVMLERFSRDFDAAFAYEAADDDSPVEPGAPFLQLVLDEWRASLELSMMRDPMSVMSDPGWRAFLKDQAARADGSLEHSFSAHYSHAVGDHSNPAPWAKDLAKSIEKLKRWMAEGMSGKAPWAHGKADPAKWALLRALMGPEHDGEKPSYAPLCELEALFSEQRQLPPSLTQGTVLRCADGTYLVCTTPLCDAARPSKIMNVFTFVTAEQVAVQHDKKGFYKEHGCVVHDAKNLVCLHIKAKPIVSLRIEDPRLHADVLAHPWAPQPRDEASTESIPPIILKPISQLRSQYALALCESVSAEAGRIGLDRVEFFRRQFEK